MDEFDDAAKRELRSKYLHKRKQSVLGIRLARIAVLILFIVLWQKPGVNVL